MKSLDSSDHAEGFSSGFICTWLASIFSLYSFRCTPAYGLY